MRFSIVATKCTSDYGLGLEWSGNDHNVHNILRFISGIHICKCSPALSKGFKQCVYQSKGIYLYMHAQKNHIYAKQLKKKR